MIYMYHSMNHQIVNLFYVSILNYRIHSRIPCMVIIQVLPSFALQYHHRKYTWKKKKEREKIVILF